MPKGNSYRNEQKHKTAESYFVIKLTVMSIKTVCIHVGKLDLRASRYFKVNLSCVCSPQPENFKTINFLSASNITSMKTFSRVNALISHHNFRLNPSAE